MEAHKKDISHTSRPEKGKPSPKKTPPKLSPRFVAGIGASAGGLEATSLLLKYLPENLGIAYVIIQHLDPMHTSILPELLEKKTNMPVMSVEEGVEVKADHIYVIPPNTLMTIEDNHLKLAPRKKTDGSVHSIDHFLSSLADSFSYRSIGIILSGTATDGTVGVKAVKMEGGITFAQDESAKFQGMPQSAADSGCIDYVLPPDKIAAKLKSVVQQSVNFPFKDDDVDLYKDGIGKALAIVKQEKGLDFLLYKKNTIYRRLMRRLVLTRSKTLDNYVKLLKEDPKEVDHLYRDLLINVTSFFREPSIHKALEERILPALLESGLDSKAPFRAWVPGCATGEEAYSIAICLREWFGNQDANNPIKIFATDINEESIEHARKGTYLKNEMQNISSQHLDRYFTKINGHYQVIKEIRDMCVFSPHNLLSDPPFSNMDLVSCRNVLIYLEPEAQIKILQIFHYALKQNGFLLLGKSESISRAGNYFSRVDNEYNAYSKKVLNTNLELSFSMRRHYEGSGRKGVSTSSGDPNKLSLESETNKVLLKNYVPPGVLIDKDLNILRFNGAVSPYLDPDQGRASLNLLKMAKEEFVPDLRRLINQIKKEGNPVKKEHIRFQWNGQASETAIEVAPVRTPGDVYYLVLFKENKAARKMPSAHSKPVSGKKMSPKENRIMELEEELKDVREHVKSMNEDFEATREELQSSNEEVLSSNEELQSLNEELETSKEELQSSNEELMTVNEELQSRNDELKDARDYAEAIVETVPTPLMVLNENMRVHSANKAYYQTFGLTPDETEGNLFYEIGNGQWENKEFNKVLTENFSRNKKFFEFEIKLKFHHSGERTIVMSAQRLIQENKQTKILIGMEDVTDRRKIDEILFEKKKDERFKLLADNAPVMIWMEDTNKNRNYFNNTWLQFRGKRISEETGHAWEDGIHPDDLERTLQTYNKAFEERKGLKQEFRLKHNSGKYRWILSHSVPVYEHDDFSGYIGSCMDINYRVEQEKQRDEFIAVASHELKTPLTSLKIYVEILRQMLKETNDTKSIALIGKTDSQIDRLILLINEMLDATRIDEKRLPLANETINIQDLITEVVDDMNLSLKSHKLEKRFGAPKMVSVDKERIRQVLVNFISNAVKYSPDADHVVISTRSEGNSFKVSVQDFGIGISDKLHDRVFQRFFRAPDPHNSFPGIGLGLYISAEIIRRHGGKVGFKSKLEEGSVFWFSLPIKKE